MTDRVPVIVRTKDGTIIEVSEWKSHEAIEEAHKNPRVRTRRGDSIRSFLESGGRVAI